MDLKWLRGRETINYHRPMVFFVLGVRGGGKSSLLEYTGTRYLDAGHVVFDLFGSRDGEGLAWLRSPYAKDKKILLLHGENVDVDSSFPCKPVDKVTLSDFEKNDLVISASPLHLSIDQEFADAARLTDLLYKRMHYKRLVYLMAREAANFYYSRLKVSDNQLFAKSQMVYLIREARHMGVSLGLDSLRMYAVDIDIRHLTDYLYLKSQGVAGLSKDIKWLYSYISPVLLRNMKPHRFVLVCRSGSIGYGTFPFPEWHKREREDILKELDIRVEYGEPAEEGKDRGKRGTTIGDKEHEIIISLYNSGLGMLKISKKVHRSTASIKNHIDRHNRSVMRSGFCAACRRVRGKNDSEKAVCR